MRKTYLLGSVLLIGLVANAASCFGQLEITDTLAADYKVKPVQTNDYFFEAMKAKMHDDNASAIDLFKKFLEIQPNAASGYYELALIYEEGKSPDNAVLAENNIKKAISLDGSNKWYQQEYAVLLAGRSRFGEAGDVAAQLADRETTDAGYAALASGYYERAQKYAEALTYIDKAIARSGSDEDMLTRKMQICLEMNDMEKAAETVKLLITQDPKNGKYYKLLGELYDNGKMWEQAMEVYRNAEKQLPDDPSIEVGLAEHYQKTGDSVNYRIYARKAILNKKLDVETQLEIFEVYVQGMSDSAIRQEGLPIVTELVAMHPREPLLLAAYADFLESDGQPEKAIEYFKKSVAIKPSDFNVWERLLGALSDKSQADTLIRYSEKAIRLFPNQAIAHYYNGVAHYNKKEHAAAIKSLNRAASLAPDQNAQVQAIIYSLLGDVYNANKEYDESDAAFGKALDYQPDNATVLNNYAYYLSERGKRLDAAREMSEKAIKVRPNEATFLDTYAWILYKKGDYEKAKANSEKAIELAGKQADGTLYDHLGDILYKLGNKTQAVENWKAAVQKGCDDPLLDKKITDGKLYE